MKKKVINKKHTFQLNISEELFKELETTVTTLTDAMRGGMADATPLKTGQRGACDYCSFKPLCRNAHV